MQTLIERSDSFGGVLVDNGRRLEIHRGYQKLDEPNHAGTRYRIFSLTKAVAAVAVLLLVQDGRLRLDDPVNEIGKLSTFTNVTARDLLQHRSGVFNAVNFVFFDRGSDLYSTLVPSGCTQTEVLDTDDLLRVITEHADDDSPTARRNRTAPRGTFDYNNTGYDLLGHLIDVLSDDGVERFLDDRIFHPLDMDASVVPDDPDAPHHARPFQTEVEYGILENQGPTNTNANVACTLEAYRRFLTGYSKLLTDPAILATFHDLYFFRNTVDGHRVFFASGSGDFPTTGEYRFLSKSMALFDVNTRDVLIVAQNYEGPNWPLLHRDFSARRTSLPDAPSLAFDRLVPNLFPGLRERFLNFKT